jgi:crotonobetainyl-CoA:carnitine CoA-transferase CaiB-like acyl-CoA transferase
VKEENMVAALEGIRVLDMTNGVAGSSSTKLLADLGAEVLKVESPGKGEFTRSLVPWAFQSFNREKRSVAIDIHQPEGRDLILRLAAASDVFVQSMRPGLLEGVGLGREALTAANPRLIHASVSAWGPAGPKSHRKGVDAVVQAESGLASIQGKVLGNTSFVDASAGISMAYAIVGALFQRERTGVVDHVTVNLLDTGVYLAQAPTLEHSVTGYQFEPQAYAQRFPTVRVFEGSDGPFFVAAYRDPEWRILCEVSGATELLEDARFATTELRAEHIEEITALLGKRLAERPREEWVVALGDQGVMAGVLRNQGDMVRDEQVTFNQSLEQVEMSDGRVGQFARPPYRFVDEPLPKSRPAPTVGADTADVLAGILGLDAQEQERLAEAGIVQVGP